MHLERQRARPQKIHNRTAHGRFSSPPRKLPKMLIAGFMRRQLQDPKRTVESSHLGFRPNGVCESEARNLGK